MLKEIDDSNVDDDAISDLMLLLSFYGCRCCLHWHFHVMSDREDAPYTTKNKIKINK